MVSGGQLLGVWTQGSNRTWDRRQWKVRSLAFPPPPQKNMVIPIRWIGLGSQFRYSMNEFPLLEDLEIILIQHRLFTVLANLKNCAMTGYLTFYPPQYFHLVTIYTHCSCQWLQKLWQIYIEQIQFSLRARSVGSMVVRGQWQGERGELSGTGTVSLSEQLQQIKQGFSGLKNSQAFVKVPSKKQNTGTWLEFLGGTSGSYFFMNQTGLRIL